jgi:putative antitoxin of VapBC-like toxin-antitoxin system
MVISTHTPIQQMKTTIELSDAALDEARRVAAREGTSLRALIEEGLRRVLAERRRRPGFRLRRVTFGGEGLAPEFSGESWPAIRDSIYRERGA